MGYLFGDLLPGYWVTYWVTYWEVYLSCQLSYLLSLLLSYLLSYTLSCLLSYLLRYIEISNSYEVLTLVYSQDIRCVCSQDICSVSSQDICIEGICILSHLNATNHHTRATQPRACRSS